METVRFRGANNSELVGTFYDNEKSDKGIIMFPGISEHRVSLDELAESLAKSFKVWAFDLNSQGDSTGNWDLEEMADSVDIIGRKVKKDYNLERLGLFGNSLGGMAGGIAATYEDTPLDILCFATTSSSMFDYFSESSIKIFRNFPSLVTLFLKGFDFYQTKTNKLYKNLTHRKSKENNWQGLHFGATKIPDIKEFFDAILKAPNLIDYVDKIEQPIFFLYGGNDRHLKFHNGKPEQIERMFEKTASKYKSMDVIQKADHALNLKTPPDSHFNHAPELEYLKSIIASHFRTYMDRQNI